MRGRAAAIARPSTGLAWVLAIFAATAVVAIVFVARFLPETKHHSVEEITRIFERQAARV